MNRQAHPPRGAGSQKGEGLQGSGRQGAALGIAWRWFLRGWSAKKGPAFLGRKSKGSTGKGISGPALPARIVRPPAPEPY